MSERTNEGMFDDEINGVWINIKKSVQEWIDQKKNVSVIAEFIPVSVSE